MVQDESLFNSVLSQIGSIALPKGWFFDISMVDNNFPVAVTFFTLNKFNNCSQRYLEKQLILSKGMYLI